MASRRSLSDFVHRLLKNGSAIWSRTAAVFPIEQWFRFVDQYHTCPRTPGRVKLASMRYCLLASFAAGLAFAASLGLAEPGEIDAGQPEFIGAFDAALSATPIADWQAYLRWHLIHAAAPCLNAAVVNENFDFFGRKLTGRQQLRDRWKRVLETVDGGIGEALGQLYVAGNFPPESKKRMLKLVGNVRAALRDRLQTLEWMDEPTRAAALKKLDAFGVKIGYPDKWIDYSTLTVDRGPFVLNVFRADEFNFRRDLAKIGRPENER